MMHRHWHGNSRPPLNEAAARAIWRPLLFASEGEITPAAFGESGHQ